MPNNNDGNGRHGWPKRTLLCRQAHSGKLHVRLTLQSKVSRCFIRQQDPYCFVMIFPLLLHFFFCLSVTATSIIVSQTKPWKVFFKKYHEHGRLHFDQVTFFGLITNITRIVTWIKYEKNYTNVQKKTISSLSLSLFLNNK